MYSFLENVSLISWERLTHFLRKSHSFLEKVSLISWESLTHVIGGPWVDRLTVYLYLWLPIGRRYWTMVTWLFTTDKSFRCPNYLSDMATVAFAHAPSLFVYNFAGCSPVGWGLHHCQQYWSSQVQLDSETKALRKGRERGQAVKKCQAVWDQHEKRWQEEQFWEFLQFHGATKTAHLHCNKHFLFALHYLTHYIDLSTFVQDLPLPSTFTLSTFHCTARSGSPHNALHTLV